MNNNSLDDELSVFSAMRGQVRNILLEVVENTEVTRQKLSSSVIDLETAGFLFIKKIPNVMHIEYNISAPMIGWGAACAWMDEQNLNDKDEQLLFKTKKTKDYYSTDNDQSI